MTGATESVPCPSSELSCSLPQMRGPVFEVAWLKSWAYCCDNVPVFGAVFLSLACGPGLTGQEWLFSSDALVCSGVYVWCAMSHFVLEKSRLAGRKERGRGVAGGAGVRGRGQPQPPEEMQEWGWAPDAGWSPISGCPTWTPWRC